ncbi:MAG: hypothetical protein F4Z20_00480 [Gammaproteobacteria bacterium]|nr:hypothetical protein [Gammaproteobacteria bacterium]
MIDEQPQAGQPFYCLDQDTSRRARTGEVAEYREGVVTVRWEDGEEEQIGGSANPWSHSRLLSGGPDQPISLEYWAVFRPSRD